jgi:hypothetical protein
MNFEVGNKRKTHQMRDLMRYDEMWYSKCGEGGIRTPGPVTVNGFQDRRNRPLCHLSGRKIKASNSIFKKKVKLFFKAFTTAVFSNKPFTQLSRIFRL